MKNNTSAARAGKIIALLKNVYPNAKIVLRYRNTWELLVSVILSAQCTDIVVNKVTEKLFLKYRTLNDYVSADIREFEQDIKSTGFYKNKAKNILASAVRVQHIYGGKVPDTMEALLNLPGVARKTANVVLGNAYHVVEGIAVDTHVQRISQRLRLVSLERIGGKKELHFAKQGKENIDYKKDADPVKIEQELMKVLPKMEWFGFTYLVIDHGRAVCKAQNPACAVCILATLCPSSRV